MASKTINLFLHGASEGFNTELIQFLFQKLNERQNECFGFDFEYIKSGGQPSLQNEKEIEELKNVIDSFQKKGYQKINIIGKSMGGVISLHEDIISNPIVNKIIILGFPVKIGFPLELDLLKENPFKEKPGYVKDYVEHLNKLGDLLNKLTIIQGLEDLLGTKKDIDEINLQLKHQLNISYIKNATHGFYPITNETIKEENFNNVLNQILTNIL